MSSRAKSRLLLILASVCFALFLVEIPALFGVVDYRVWVGGARWEALNVDDPGLLQIHRPYAHTAGTNRGGDASLYYQLPLSDQTLFHWDVKYDRNGFRNDHDFDSAEMVVIGDSFVEDIPTPTAQLMTSLLAQARGETVANLGQMAYGPQQESIVLDRYGLPLKPRTVVWMFFEGNDLTDVMHYREARRKPATTFEQRSFLFSSLKLAKHHIFSRNQKPAGIRRAGFLSTSGTMYFSNPAAPLNAEDLSALDETLAILADAGRRCRAQNAHLIFVFVPDKFRVFHDLCSFPEASECRNWTLNDLPLRMRKAITSIPDLGYVDLTPALISAAEQGKLPYYPDDMHWTPEGHRVAAESINAYLAQYPTGYHLTLERGPSQPLKML